MLPRRAIAVLTLTLATSLAAQSPPATLPARIMGLKDRGQIREGFAADLIVFDLDRIRNKAAFFEPHQHSEGIEHVLISGAAAVDAGKPTQALPGRVLGR